MWTANSIMLTYQLAPYKDTYAKSVYNWRTGDVCGISSIGPKAKGEWWKCKRKTDAAEYVQQLGKKMFSNLESTSE